MKTYGIMAVTCGLIAPFFWTVKCYYARLVVENKEFDLYEMSIDQNFFQNIFALVLYLIFFVQNPFEWNEFIEGQITGFFFVIGGIFATNSFQTGPGGPINALITTQIIYQTFINAIWMG